MKKRIAFIVVVVLGLSICLPAAGYCRPPYRYARGGYYCNSGCGWTAAAIVGGALVAALIVGAVTDIWKSDGRPATRRDAATGNRRVAYAYPDPGATAGSAARTQSPYRAPSGEWVVVPAQRVNGVPVPEHRVWVADDTDLYGPPGPASRIDSGIAETIRPRASAFAGSRYGRQGAAVHAYRVPPEIAGAVNSVKPEGDITPFP